MLRNRGVNVTERRIRHDVLRAYEYDIFDARPRWRGLHDAGCQAHCYRQPRYCTARSYRPVNYHTASSGTSYGVKRVYLPDEDWGPGSGESAAYVRNPKYNMGSYYPNEPYHLSAERQYGRDFRCEGYYSRRPSSMYIDEEDYCPNWISRYTDRNLVRKVTKKLSPIFTCDCATTSNVRSVKKNNKSNVNNKTHHSDLSKEAKELSLDIFKIMSLLQKADGEEEEQFSSVSLLQNIHNLDCRSSNNLTKLITQRVNICQKMERHKPDDPLTKFKTASGVRSRLEALVDALKQFEAESLQNRTDSSNSSNLAKYKNVIPSDPPSLEVRSFSNGKYLKSSTNIHADKRKDIVLQTEEPKMSNKSVYGKVKLKKGDARAERKSLRSRLSWRKREGSGIKMRRDSGNERLTDKTERKRSFFCKTKSKSRIRSAFESEHSQSEKNVPTKQGQANKAGLMIKIGGNPQRKKSASPEKHKEKMPKTWIKKFLEDKKDTKNNIRIRWNNKAFYTKSSSTIFELVSNVYKQMGIHNSKSDEVSTSKPKKAPKRTTHKQSKTKILKSSKKPKYKQKVEAYMMPQIIVPGPVYTPNVTNKDTEKCVSKPRESKPYLNEFTTNFYSGFNMTRELSTNYFQIQLPKNFFDPESSSEEQKSDNQGYKTVDYVATKSDAFEESLVDYSDGMSGDLECAVNGSISLDASEDVHSEDVVQVSNSFPKRCEDGEVKVTQKEPELEPSKSRIQIQELIAEETERPFPKSCCSLAEKYLHNEYFNWMPMSSDSLLLTANCEELEERSMILDNVSIWSGTDTATKSINEDHIQNVPKKVAPKRAEAKDGHFGKKFNALNNNFIQWRNRAAGTFSDSIVGIKSRKPVVLSVFWNLVKLLRKDHSPKSGLKLPPHDLSLVQPPGIVSQPECSYKSQILLTRKPLRAKNLKIPFEPLRLAQLASTAFQAKKEAALVITSAYSMQFVDLAEDAVEVEKPENLSVLASPAETREQSDKILILDEPSGPINDESVRTTVPDETKVEQETSLTTRKQVCQIRLVRSVHAHLQTERNIQPKAVRSVLLHHHQIHQLKSQLLLFVRPVYNGHTKIEQILDKYKQSEEPQPPNLSQCLSVLSKCEVHDDKVQSEYENNTLKETVNNSQDTVRSENTVDTVVQKLSSNETDPVEVYSKQSNTEIKKLNIDRSDKREFCDLINDRKPTKKKQLTYVTQIPELKNDTFASEISRFLDVQCVEVTKGDAVTKIFIKNRNKSKKDNHFQSTNLRISEDPVVNTNNSEPIKQSTKRISKKNVKVCIHIRNINTKEPKNFQNLVHKTDSNHESSSLKEVEEYEMAATDCIDSKNTTVYPADSQHCSVYKTHSQQPFTDCSLIDDMSGTNTQRLYVPKSLSERRISVNEFNDSYLVNEKSLHSQSYDITAEEYVNDVLGATDKIDSMKLKKIVEMRRTLNAMMMLNVSAFTESALMREPISDHNDTYTTLRQQLKRRKNIVSILSEINIRNIRTDYLRQRAKAGNADFIDDSGTSGSCSLCNVLARKLNSHRCVEIDMPTDVKVSANGDIADQYLPHLATPIMPRCLELEDLMTSLKEEPLSNNSGIFINNDNAGIGAVLMKSMWPSLTTNTQEIHEAKPICWCCVKNMNKKSKRNQTKKWRKKKHTNRVSNSCQKDAIILEKTDSNYSQKTSFTEYRIRFKDVDPTMVNYPVETLYSEGNSDILQSCKIKKAVLQLYSDETVDNGGYLVAKIPKYLRL